MNVCRGCDEEVHRAPARPSSAVGDGSGEPAPLPGNRGIHRDRIESCLDDREPLCPASAFVSVGGDQKAEVKFGQ